MKRPKILIVEDEAIIALDIKIKLLQLGYVVAPIAESAADACELAETFHPDIILMDIVLKGKDSGIQAAKRIHKKNKVPVIFITGNTHLINDIEKQFPHHCGILTKPPSDWQIFEFIRRAWDPESPCS